MLWPESIYIVFVILQIATGRYFGSTDAAFNEIQNPDGSNTEAHIGGKRSWNNGHDGEAKVYLNFLLSFIRISIIHEHHHCIHGMLSLSSVCVSICWEI